MDKHWTEIVGEPPASFILCISFLVNWTNDKLPEHKVFKLVFIKPQNIQFSKMKPKNDWMYKFNYKVKYCCYEFVCQSYDHFTTYSYSFLYHPHFMSALLSCAPLRCRGAAEKKKRMLSPQLTVTVRSAAVWVCQDTSPQAGTSHPN